MSITVNRAIEWLTDETGTLRGYRRGHQDDVIVASVVAPADMPEAGAVVISPDAPADADGRPDGTIYIQTA